jgi:hypothetical protein
VTVHVLTLPPGAVWSKATAGSYRHEARKAARAAGATAYEIRGPRGGLLWRCDLIPLKPKPRPEPKLRPLPPGAIGLTPEAVEAAYLKHGPRAPAVLGCTKQAISGSKALREARERAYAALGYNTAAAKGKRAQGGATYLRLYLGPPEILKLEQRARAVGWSTISQIVADVLAWLADPGPTDEEPDAPVTRAVHLPAQIIEQVEAAVGVHLRTRAIEAAVRRANA